MKKKKLNLSDVRSYVESNIASFHEKRIENLNRLELDKILKRKNPYLFKAKCAETAETIVKNLIEAHNSSSEEGIFGDWLEGLAIYINNKVYGGWKSGIPGIDLEFDLDGRRNIVNIKSGPNWGNSSQIKKMKIDFLQATKSLTTSNSKLNVISINGCCYGRDNKPNKGDYHKLCGQSFWKYISGDANLYLDLIEPLGFKAKEKNEEYNVKLTQVINRFTKQFLDNYCYENGSINWNKIVSLNSQILSNKKSA